MGLSFMNRDYDSRGAARIAGRHCDKEPDLSIYPNNNGGFGGSPSFVLEVGLSESFAQLKTNARWWYANTKQETKLVVLIKVSREPT
jgi:hypothetical protein